jgi:hypothetical protein
MERPAATGGGPENSYQYQQLNGVDEFRLLVISPGSFDDALRGEVITAKSSGTDRPVYEALSYTWADVTLNLETPMCRYSKLVLQGKVS